MKQTIKEKDDMLAWAEDFNNKMNSSEGFLGTELKKVMQFEEIDTLVYRKSTPSFNDGSPCYTSVDFIGPPYSLVDDKLIFTDEQGDVETYYIDDIDIDDIDEGFIQEHRDKLSDKQIEALKYIAGAEDLSVYDENRDSYIESLVKEYRLPGTLGFLYLYVLACVDEPSAEGTITIGSEGQLVVKVKEFYAD